MVAKYRQEGIDFKGKKVAVIGTGASGVTVFRRLAQKLATSQVNTPIISISIKRTMILTISPVLQRTSNLCLPMNQRKLDPNEEAKVKEEGGYEQVFKYRLETFCGFHFNFDTKEGGEDNADQKRALYEKLWSGGGFRFWLAYKD